MFIAALFTVAKTWKQAKYPSEEEWIKKTLGGGGVYTHAMEYYSAIKNEIMPFVAAWMNLRLSH